MDTESLESHLKVGDEWQEVEPASSGYTLLTDGEKLIANSTSFDHATKIGYISGVNCPIAVDHTNKIAYRSVHQKISETPKNTDGYFDNIAVEIRSFDLRSSKSVVVTKLPKGLDCYWLLELLPNQRKLLALFTERKQKPQSYLGTIDLENGSITRTPLPDNAFYPSALSLEREQIVFSGSHGGAVLINFDGGTVGALDPGSLYNLEGADFIGSSRDIVLGGNGLHIWDPEAGSFETVVYSGSYPVSNCAGQIWFNVSDGAVSYYDLQSKTIKSVASLEGLELYDTGYAQPVVFSLDRRMVLARLAENGSSIAKSMRQKRGYTKKIA